MATLNKSKLPPSPGRRLNKSALPPITGDPVDLEEMIGRALEQRLPALIEDFASKALEEMSEEDIEAELAELEGQPFLGDFLDGDDGSDDDDDGESSDKKGVETGDEDPDEEPDEEDDKDPDETDEAKPSNFSK